MLFPAPRRKGLNQEFRYSKRKLPHFERPWAKYAIAFPHISGEYSRPQRTRILLLRSACYGHEHLQYELYVACVMPDHVHLLFEPKLMDERRSMMNQSSGH